MASNGYILAETSDIVVIATGTRSPSNNPKTGDMVQVWILTRRVTPLDAIATGQDSLICGNCPHRGDKATGRKRSCYVTVRNAPQQVYKAYQRGRYPQLALEDFERVLGGKAIRLGAYGDPAFIPEVVLCELIRVGRTHTGYTHQWRENQWLRPYLMASCDTRQDYIDANSRGWRTFRVTSDLTKERNEVLCPASEQAGHRTQCARCGLCNGAGMAKNVFIPVHGAGAKNALVVLQ